MVELWFLAADVTKELDLTNMSMALQNLTEGDVQSYRVPGTRGRPNKVISEGGLYKLIMRSNKPSARDFKDWLANVVHNVWLRLADRGHPSIPHMQLRLSTRE